MDNYPERDMNPPEGIVIPDDFYKGLMDKTVEEFVLDQLSEPYGNGRTYLGQLLWLQNIGGDLGDFIEEIKREATDNDQCHCEWMHLHGWDV